MSCNTSLPLARIVRQVRDILAKEFITQENPAITNGVFTTPVLNSPSIRGDVLFDAAAEAAIRRIIGTSGPGGPGQMGPPGPVGPALKFTDLTAPQKLELKGAGAIAKPLTIITPALVSKTAKTIMTSVSRDRTHGWGYAANTLDETWDDGETWTTIHTISGGSIDAVTELGNGELLIVTAHAGAMRKVWRTVGKDTDTMTLVECFVGHAAGVEFTSSWSIFTHENMVLVADYGPKAGSTWAGVAGNVPLGDNARYVRVSLNNGKTWQTVFDLNEFLPSKGYPIEGSHLHGIAYDKWWDRLWLSFGDNAYNIGGLLFSDDFGQTWHWANEGKVDKDNAALSPPNSTCQVVGIIPIEGCILLGTDTSPNGVLKIDRKQGKKLTKYKIEVGYAINAEPMTTHLCQGIYQASDNHPVFFAFGSELTSSKSCIVATWDGVNFEKVWEDSIKQPAGFGLRSVVAPTVRGNLIAASNDQRTSGFWSEIKDKAPIY